MKARAANAAYWALILCAVLPIAWELGRVVFARR